MRASRAACVLALRLLLRGDAAMANGWLSRAERLLRDAPSDCVERARFAADQGNRLRHPVLVERRLGQREPRTTAVDGE